MINPEKNNKRIFWVIVVVFLGTLGFAAWLAISNTLPLK
jgi:type IV secretory pathway component VirB8